MFNRRTPRQQQPMKQETSAGIVTFYWDATQQRPLYLLLHYVSGHWDLPKGKLEPGETKEQAAHRELKEETSLEAQLSPNFEESISYIFRDRNGSMVHKDVYFFIGETHSQQVTISREHQGFIWLPIGEALQQLTFENARRMVQAAHEVIMQQKHT